ncbi:MAG: hypothetical protein KKB60_06680, partial [Gammaproteobacteria bacterium]|nr:hypothetical protein [Gammaproteobacteria bacterium]MBU1528852.1 hypothetical protein [Gammaproteobacteria bacterium]
DPADRPSLRSRREALQSRPAGAAPKPRVAPTPLPARSGGNALAAPIKKTCPFSAFARFAPPSLRLQESLPV